MDRTKNCLACETLQLLSGPLSVSAGLYKTIMVPVESF